MSEFANQLFIGLFLSLPVGVFAYAAARRLGSAAGERPDRVWTLAMCLTAAPLALSVIAANVSRLWPVALEVPVLGSLLEPVGGMAASDGSLMAGSSGSISFWLVAGLVWLLGMMASATVEFVRSWRLRHLLGTMPLANREMASWVNRRAMQRGLKRALTVRVSTVNASPFLCGLGRYTLVLPASFGRGFGERSILDHELAHAARNDPRMALLMRILGLPLWFNPLWRALERRRRIAVEMTCDAEVVRGSDPGAVRLYARALLDTARADSGFAPAVGFGVTHNEALKMRLAHILTPTPILKVNQLTAGAISAVLLLACAMGLQTAYAAGLSLSPPVFSHSVLEGRFTSGFGPRPNPRGVPQHHRGVDVAAPLGLPVRAPASGRVTYVGDGYEGSSSWGRVVVIDHGAGWSTLYAHLGDTHVSEGDSVGAGTMIADIGLTGLTTGPHVHVEVHHDGVPVDPALHLPGLDRSNMH
jgi:murein DD-endopeptidase MepM/ murein hydrolase activator NlpD